MLDKSHSTAKFKILRRLSLNVAVSQNSVSIKSASHRARQFRHAAAYDDHLGLQQIYDVLYEGSPTPTGDSAEPVGQTRWTGLLVLAFALMIATVLG
jgi:hypothetical protein